MTFVPIQHRDRAKQLVSFKGMELGENIWPTDFDSVIDWHGNGWLVFEVKHGSAPFPTGQKKALERFVKDMGNGGKHAVAAVVEHSVEDPNEDIVLADCIVRQVYCFKEGKWRKTKRPITAGELERQYIAYIDECVRRSNERQ